MRTGHIVTALVLVALLLMIPGSHLLALWMSSLMAIIVSHAAGVVLLGVAVQQWRGRRRPPSAGHPA